MRSRTDDFARDESSGLMLPRGSNGIARLARPQFMSCGPSLISPASGGDPHFSNVTSLNHFDGANGATAITDQKGLVWTRRGLPTISTAQFQFGGASGSFNGSSSYWDTPSTPAWDFGAGDFTLEAWVRLTALDSGNFGTIIAKRNTGSAGDDVFFLTVGTTGPILQVFTAGATLAQTTASGVGLTANVWYFIAATRSGATLRVFKDGVLEGSGSVTGALQAGTTPVCIGALSSIFSNRDWNGFIDDVRVTKGVARYTSAFSVPVAAFPNS